MMTTEVVPSPTSLSCFWARSTKILPAGCSTDRRDRIVAPSLDIVTSYSVGGDQLAEMHNRGMLQYPDVVHKHFIETERTQGTFDDVCNGLCGDD